MTLTIVQKRRAFSLKQLNSKSWLKSNIYPTFAIYMTNFDTISTYFFSLSAKIGETFNGTLFVEILGGVIFMSTSIFQTEMVFRENCDLCVDYKNSNFYYN